MRKSLLLGTLILAAVAIGRAEAGVTLSYPNGGEEWCVGTTQTITWSHTPDLEGKKVKVEISRDGAGGPWVVLGQNLPSNPKQFSWTVTDPETSKARIRVTINGQSDKSEANFKIVKPLFTCAEETFTIPNDGSFTLSLIVCPSDQSGYDYKYIYTLKSLDTSSSFPNSFIGQFAISNCRDAFLAKLPNLPNGTPDNGWEASTWHAPATEEEIWNTDNTASNGIGPSKPTLTFCVYTDRKPVISTFVVRSLHFKNAYDYGTVRAGTFEYCTPGCPSGGGGDEGCLHEFNLAQVYPVDSYGTLPDFPDLSCWSGESAVPISPDKLAVPGVLCLATNNKGYLDWEAFVSGSNGDTCCADPVVQSVDLKKVSPPSMKCPIFGGYKVHQFGHKNIRTWWPLAYTMPGTTFTLTLQGMCKNPNKPYKETWRWTVVANPDTFNHLIDLFHTNALGELEVPSIVGEDIYAALKECAAHLKDAIDALKADPTDPYLKNDARDAILECEAIIICNTLFLDHLDAPEEMTYPYHQAAPKRILPGNLAIPDPDVQKCEDGSGGVIGIIDTDQNPAACKLIVDLEWINDLIFGDNGDDEEEDHY